MGRNPRWGTVILSLCLIWASPIRAELMFEQPIKDLGRILSGPTSEHDFAFKNTGPEAIHITEIKASCGCLDPEVDKQVVQPGKRGNIKMRVHSLSAPAGAHSWRLIVHYRTNGQIHQRAAVIRAVVRKEIDVRPPAMKLSVSREIKHSITVSDTRPMPLSVRGAESNVNHVQARRVEGKGRVEVTIGKDMPPGIYEGFVTIYTDDPSYSELNVPIFITKRAAKSFRAFPPRVHLTAHREKPVASRIVTIQNTTGRTFDIVQINTSHDEISCVPTEQGIKISVDLSQLESKSVEGSAQIWARVKDSSKRQLVEIPVSCVVRE